MAAVPGTSIAESLRLGERVDRALLALPEVRSVGQQVGRAELGDDTWGPNYSELEVDLEPGLSGDAAEDALDHIRKALSGFVGVNFAVNTFLTERIDETLSGDGAPVVVKVFGEDLDALDRAAQAIARVLRAVPGAEDVQLASPPGLPQVTIGLRRADVARWGFDPVDVLDQIRTAYQGETVGQVYRGNRVYNVMAILDPATRDDIAKIRALPLRSPAGVYVPLGRLADVYLGAGRYQVMHEGARRLQTVTANVSGRDVASFVAAAKRAIAARVKLPPGTYLEYAGAAQAERRSRSDLLADSLAAGAGIVLLLSFVTRNWRNLLLVLANLPFALVGRSARGARHRRRALARRAGGVHRAVRHLAAQLDPDDRPLRAAGRKRGPVVEPRHRRTRRRRQADRDPDDLAGDRARRAAARARHGGAPGARSRARWRS